MSKQLRTLVKLCAATSVLLAMTACATVATPRIVDSSCLSFSPMTYANAKAGQETADDPGNKLDTAETVLAIAIFNASWRAICEASD